MKFVGVDLHKKSLTLCVMNQAREVLQRARLSCAETERLCDLLRALGPFEIVVEATVGYEWFTELVAPLATRTVLCHPKKMRIIAESTRKSDKLDATVLAEFLALDMIPAAHRPLARQKGQQVLVRERKRCSDRVRNLKCRLRALLTRYNADRPQLFRAANRSYLETVALRPADRIVRRQLLADYDHAVAQLASIARELREYATAAGQREQEQRALLGTIPGIGVNTIDAWCAEIGDARRFSSAKKLVSYVGLDPGFRSSDETTRELGISKQGSRLMRWILIQAAWASLRASTRWRRVYDGVAKRRGSKRAIVAVARHLATVMFAVVRDGRPYDPLAA